MRCVPIRGTDVAARGEHLPPGARLVKAFSHLAAAKLAADPELGGGARRVIFVSSDDEDATGPVVYARPVPPTGSVPTILARSWKINGAHTRPRA